MTDEELMKLEPDIRRLQSAVNLLDRDRSAGIALLQELADTGSVVGMLHLAYAYQASADADEQKVRDWYQAAYDHGSLSGLFSLGVNYYRRREFTEAERVFSEGAASGHLGCMYWLASTYIATGRKVERAGEIRVLLENAMKRGHIPAKHQLGWLMIHRTYGITNVPKGIFLLVTGAVAHARMALRDPSNQRLQ